MRLIRPALNIDPANPFGSDKLRRKDTANELTNLFRNLSDQIVLNLYSEWGEGKTTFVKMWQAALELQGDSIYLYRCL